MKHNHLSKLVRAMVLGACLLVGTQLSHALSYRVYVDTSSLAVDPNAPFALDFQLIGGDPLANSITISNFNFGGGNASNDPAATAFGGATGDLGLGVTLTTTQFFNEFFQGFVPGTTLRFDVEFNSNVNTPTPDAFSFSILNKDLFQIPTDALDGVSLFRIEFDSADPTPQAFTADNGVSVKFGSVPLEPTPGVPDSGTTLSLLGLALVGIIAARKVSWVCRLSEA